MTASQHGAGLAPSGPAATGADRMPAGPTYPADTFAKALASIRTVEEIDGFLWGCAQYRDLTTGQRQALATRKAQLQLAQRKGKR